MLSRKSFPLVALFAFILAMIVVYAFLALEDVYQNTDFSVSESPIENQTLQSDQPPSFYEQFKLSSNNHAQSTRPPKAASRASSSKPLTIKTDQPTTQAPDSNRLALTGTKTTPFSDKDLGDQWIQAPDRSNNDANLARAQQIKMWWSYYTNGIPQLAAASEKSENYSDNVEFIASSAANLDIMFEQSPKEWKSLFQTDLNRKLINLASSGYREAAWAMSVQWLRHSETQRADALAWAMIANAINDNAYYLYLCNPTLKPCTEEQFLRAYLKANSLIGQHQMVLKE